MQLPHMEVVCAALCDCAPLVTWAGFETSQVSITDPTGSLRWNQAVQGGAA